MSCDGTDKPITPAAQGDTWDIDVGPVKEENADGNIVPVNIGGMTLVFTLKAKRDDPDSETALRYETTVPVDETSAKGMTTFTVPAAAPSGESAPLDPPNTTDAVAPAQYFAWIQLVVAGDPPERYTVYSGTILVTPAPQS